MDGKRGKRGKRKSSAGAGEPTAGLPRKARRHADRLAFVERIEPAARRAEDLDSARLVTRFQAGDREAFATLYTRYFDRVFTYLRIALNDRDEAEDAAQDVFVRVLEGLPRYELRKQPFRGWLFIVVRNLALTLLKQQGRLEVLDPEELNRRREPETADEASDPLRALDWITDVDLLLFVERLPLPQRQVLMLRYMLELKPAEIAKVLGRTPNDISAIQYRAFDYLRERLKAIGREPKHPRPSREPATSWTKPAQVIRNRRFAL